MPPVSVQPTSSSSNVIPHATLMFALTGLETQQLVPVAVHPVVTTQSVEYLYSSFGQNDYKESMIPGKLLATATVDIGNVQTTGYRNGLSLPTQNVVDGYTSVTNSENGADAETLLYPDVSTTAMPSIGMDQSDVVTRQANTNPSDATSKPDDLTLNSNKVILTATEATPSNERASSSLNGLDTTATINEVSIAAIKIISTSTTASSKVESTAIETKPVFPYPVPVFPTTTREPLTTADTSNANSEQPEKTVAITPAQIQLLTVALVAACVLNFLTLMLVVLAIWMAYWMFGQLNGLVAREGIHASNLPREVSSRDTVRDVGRYQDSVPLNLRMEEQSNLRGLVYPGLQNVQRVSAGTGVPVRETRSSLYSRNQESSSSSEFGSMTRRGDGGSREADSVGSGGSGGSGEAGARVHVRVLSRRD
ncbi:hypothetical protein HDU78_011090 [Chytriomyces hyalinus]|nr:hypothetical protein HDU78_011090 [Chytriomyces hyalinus]